MQEHIVDSRNYPVNLHADWAGLYTDILRY